MKVRVVDSMDGSLKPGLAEDPMVELEERLAKKVAAQAREVLVELAESITVDNAQRVLGPMASLVATYNNAIAELRTEFDARPKRRRGGSVFEGGIMEPIDVTETYGAQVIQQLMAVFKDVLPGVIGQKTSGNNSREIARLTSALAEARASGHMEGVASKIEARLDTLLSCDHEANENEFLDDDVVDGEGEEVPHVDYPLPPQLVGRLPLGAEGREDLDADGDGPDASGGGAPDEVLPQGAEEGVG